METRIVLEQFALTGKTNDVAQLNSGRNPGPVQTPRRRLL